MSSNTEYGSFALIIEDEEKPNSNHRSLVFCILGVLLLAVMMAICTVTYFVIANTSVNNPNDSNSSLINSQIETDEVSKITIENCANSADTSKDNFYGIYTYEQDLQATANLIIANWNDYRDWIESNLDLSLNSGCLKNKFDSATIICDGRCDSNVLGSGRIGSDEIYICNNFLANIDDTLRSNRRACDAALMADLFSRLCLRSKYTAEKIYDETFLWWKNRFNARIGWYITNCNPTFSDVVIEE